LSKLKSFYKILIYWNSRSKNYSSLTKNIVFYFIFASGMVLFFIPFVIKSILNKTYSKEEEKVIKSWLEDNVEEYRGKNQ
jgi:hypothetical protein